MGIPLLGKSSQVLKQLMLRPPARNVPKGHFAVYVGESQRRFVVPISFLKNPLFQSLLRRAEEEFGHDHHADVLMIPCQEDAFLAVTSRLRN